METIGVDPSSIRGIAGFEGLDERQMQALAGIARPQSFRGGEHLFLLGDPADRIFIILDGAVELTIPLTFGDTVRDVRVATHERHSAVGWSAMVRPYIFTLSCRALEPTSTAAFSRLELERLFEADPRIGYVCTRWVTELLGRRLLLVQAMWAREIQRAVLDEMSAGEEASP